jgi:hypothetical protein
MHIEKWKVQMLILYISRSSSDVLNGVQLLYISLIRSAGWPGPNIARVQLLKKFSSPSRTVRERSPPAE